MGSTPKLVDYFAICGLDVTSGLEPDQLSGDNLHNPPLGRPYKSRLLAHYPESVPWNPFDEDAVCMLCFPKGVRFRTQRQKREPYFHTFIITREDGSRSFAAAYTFFEAVDNKQICAAMQTLQAMHMAELSNVQSRTLYSHLGPVYTRSPKVGSRPDPKTVGHVYDVHRDTLYVTKCLCLICQLPLVQIYDRLLTAMHQVVMSGLGPEMPLESYVYNMIHEVPLPPPGRSMQICTATGSIVCQRPGVTELPLIDYHLQELFQLLGVDNVLSSFSSILLERQVLLYSQSYERLMLVAEGITGLMFPFAWQHVYVPILPASLQHFVDAPVPFIMGLHHSTDGQALLEHCAKANMCFVNIDNGTVELPEDLPTFPHRNELREDLVQYIQYHSQIVEQHHHQQQADDAVNGHHRDSGFRDSYIVCDSGPASEAGSVSSSTWSLSGRLELLQQSEAMAKITALAKKTGVISSLEDLHLPSTSAGGAVDGAAMGNGTAKNKPKPLSPKVFQDKHVIELIFNNNIREIFLHYFMTVFNTYEGFVIQPSQDMESWLTNRETMHNFDKAAFLSDQPEGHLPFLSAFIETQMFTSYIDNKIIAQWEEPDANLRIFDARLRNFRERPGDHRFAQHHRYSMCRDTESLIEKRASHIDLVAPAPRPLEGVQLQSYRNHTFPLLNEIVLNKEPAGSHSQGSPRRQAARAKRENTRWRKKERLAHQSEHLGLSSDQREKYIQEARGKGVRQPKLSDMNPAAMAHTNWKFVETLLKECKAKTKRMLVEKMGREAVELGHGEATITGVEENTLIASLADLLERIWSHGLQAKQSKSSLWSHLLSYQEVEQCDSGSSGQTDPGHLSPGTCHTLPRRTAHSRSASPHQQGLHHHHHHHQHYHHARPPPYPGTLGHSPLERGNLDPNQLTPDLSNVALESENCPSGMQTWPIRRHKRKASRGPELPVLNSLPVSVTFDMRNVRQMTEIKTEVGYARAWVRLCLEKKVLSRNLKELLSNHDLLRSLYKRYAFLRCEEEREQFLYHLLSLNAVDYYCFTNTFTTTVIGYRILIFPQQKLGGGSTTANCWLCLAGQLGETSRIAIPKHTLDLTIQHKNLGILTTLRIGHDNAGMSPRWKVEHILVRNEVTGHTYRFPCGRWLGKGVDDGSIERLLVAEPVPATTDANELMEKCRTPPRCRSPSMPRKSNEPSKLDSSNGSITSQAYRQGLKFIYGLLNTEPTNLEPTNRMQVSRIQEMLGDSVNNLVKHFYKPEKERGSITGLLCGEYGLCYCMEHVFQCGFKSARFFRGRFFVWDFLEKVASYFDGLFLSDERSEVTPEARIIMNSFCHVISRINQASQTVGKDGRFQVFICIGVRDNRLQQWIQVVSKTPVTVQMYEEKSFLRDPTLLTFLTQILDSLKDFDISLEASLVKGVEV